MLLRLGLIIKAIDALLEIAGGVLLFFPHKFNEWIAFVCQHELIQRHANPETVAKVQTHAIHAVNHASLIESSYLLVHGIIKVVFIAAVLCHKRWGYIGLVLMLLIFTAVEMWRVYAGSGWPMFLFGAFDAYLAYLVWHEYRKAKRKMSAPIKLTASN